MNNCNKIIIIVTLLISLSFFSCSAKNTKEDDYEVSYNVLTQMEILYNNELVKIVDINSDEVELELKISYKSDIPLELEIGMMDNYTQRSFLMKNEGVWSEDDVFRLQLPTSDGSFCDAVYTIKIDKFKYKHHELIWWIKNVTKIEHHSLRAYDFLRLGINTACSADYFKTMKSDCKYINNIVNEPSFEIMTIMEDKNNCSLQFNIDMLYMGDQFINEYNSHIKDNIDFIIMTMEDNRIVPLTNKYDYIIGTSQIGENGYVTIKNVFKGKKKDQLVFLLIPFYNTENYEEIERYQKIAYNNVCYYQYIQN